MNINLVGAFIRNAPFGTEIAFQRGFERLGGHKLNIIDPDCSNQQFMLDADFTLIFKTAKEYNCILEDVSGIKIVYQPDDLRFPHIQTMMKEMLQYCDYALTFDNSGAELAKEIGYKDANELLLIANNKLYKQINCNKDIEISFVGSLSMGASHASRVKMLDILVTAGYNVQYMHDEYSIDKIVEVYNRSKIVLNHATDVGQNFGEGYGYQCRHFEVGLTNSCLLSNSLINDGKGPSCFVTFDSEQDLVQKVDMLLKDEKLRKVYANALYEELYKEHLPEHRVQELLNIIKEWI